MHANTCCNPIDAKTPCGRRIRELIAWALPSALLAIVPKCPLCLGAYVALWTGIGLSFTAATYLRWLLLFLCVASFAFLAVKRLHRVGANFSYQGKETKTCRTKS